MEANAIFPPGTVVVGPFMDDGSLGVGIVRERASGTRVRTWRAVGEGFLPVEVVVGTRCSGGYRPTSLARVPRVKAAK